MTQGAGIITGLQSSFDWRGVASSAAGTVAGQAAGKLLDDAVGASSGDPWAKEMLTRSEDLATQASLLDGMRVKTLPTRLGPLDANSSAQLGLGNLAERLSLQAGRPVNFVLYDSMEGAYSQPSLFVPKPPR